MSIFQVRPKINVPAAVDAARAIEAVLNSYEAELREGMIDAVLCGPQEAARRFEEKMQRQEVGGG